MLLVLYCVLNLKNICVFAMNICFLMMNRLIMIPLNK